MAIPMSASPRLKASSTSDDPFTSVVKLTRRARPRWEAIRSGSTDSVSDSMQAMLTVPCQVPEGCDVRAEAVEVLEHVHDVPGQHLADRRQRQAARIALEQR